MSVAPSYRYRARVARVVDGDTYDLDVDLGFYCTLRIRGRLRGVDTWEMRGEERARGIVATDWVDALLSRSDYEVTIETTKTGKYGRWLVDVTLPDGQDLAALVLQHGHGQPYGGRA